MLSSLASRRTQVLTTLDRNIDQPSCGCILRWTWQFASPLDLLPTAVELAAANVCLQHGPDRAAQGVLLDDFRQRLTARLGNARRDQAKRSD